MSQIQRQEYDVSADILEDVDGDKTAVPSVHEDAEAQTSEKAIKADTLDESRLLTGK
jgi:hypothetical protein